MPTARLGCGHGDSLDGPAGSKPTPVARGQNAPLLVFFMVWARGQSRSPSARPKKGSPDGPTLTLYTAEFGVVPVGKRLFVKASMMVDGFESLPRQFQARVPTA